MQHFKADCKGMIIHFVALFSPDPEAEAVVIVHGWPGSFLENYQTALEMQKSDRPVNIIIPSLPGFAFSSRPPLDRDYRMEDLVEVMDTLMCGLGFKEYISVGGDFGSRASVGLAGYPRCRGIHRRFLEGGEMGFD